jgi:hypothetical protein
VISVGLMSKVSKYLTIKGCLVANSGLSGKSSGQLGGRE